MATGKLEGGGAPRIQGRTPTGKLSGAQADSPERKSPDSHDGGARKGHGDRGTSKLSLGDSQGPHGEHGEKAPTPADFFAAHAEALAGLSSYRKQDIRKILLMAGDGAGGKDKPDQLYKDLGILVERHAGSEGTLAGIVNALAHRLDDPVAPALQGAITGDKAIAEILHTLAKPESIIQGKGTATCAAAVVQILVARSDPEHYAKLMANLLFEGSARAPDGGRIVLTTDELRNRELGKDTGRGAFNAAVQGSLMDFARRLEPGGDATFDGGRYRTAATYGGGRYRSTATYGGETSQAEGLTADQVKALVDRMLDGAASSVAITDGNRADALGALQAALEGRRYTGRAVRKAQDDLLKAYSKDVKSGNVSGVPVGVQTESGDLHEILVLGMTATDVIFQDPGDGQTKQVSRSQFEADMRSVVLPSRSPSFR